MNWLNLNVQTLDSENFLGSDPVDRATWLCLLRYCIGQENGGVIETCKDWADRKWQQLVRITKKEADRKCDLWAWNGETLIVWGYPADKEDEIQQKRERAKTNGAKGGRPKKTNDETNEKPTLVNSAKAEGERNEKGIGREGNCEVSQPPLCSLRQALEHAPIVKFTPEQAEHWWHNRNKAGWTMSSASGHPRKITSWQSDMATSLSWVGESLDKAKHNGNGPAKKRGLSSNDVGI